MATFCSCLLSPWTQRCILAFCQLPCPFVLAQVSLSQVYSVLDWICGAEGPRALRNPAVRGGQLRPGVEGACEDVGLEELTLQRAGQWSLACWWVGWCHPNLLTPGCWQSLSPELSLCDFPVPKGIDIRSLYNAPCVSQGDIYLPLLNRYFLHLHRAFSRWLKEKMKGNWREGKLKGKLHKGNREDCSGLTGSWLFTFKQCPGGFDIPGIIQTFRLFNSQAWEKVRMGKSQRSSSFFQRRLCDCLTSKHHRVTSTSDVLDLRLIHPYHVQRVALGGGMFLLHRTCVTTCFTSRRYLVMM